MFVKKVVNINRNAPFWFICSIYLTEFYYYLVDFINSFVFVLLLCANIIFLLIFNSKIWKIPLLERPALISLILSVFFLVFDFPLVLLDTYQYAITSYSEPEEIIEDTGIYSLGVNLTYISYIENEEEFIKNVKSDKNNYEVIDIKNKNRYKNKNTEIFNMMGIQLKSDFEKMSKVVTDYLHSTPSSIKKYFDRENTGGNSSGLSLILSSLVYQGKLENNKPIAVTGAVNKEGKVYPVGYIKEKILISIDAGFNQIIIPTENMQEAKEIKEAYDLPIEVIGVHDVDEAVELIKELNDNY
ncbi:S16 family serine protease [Gracilibacillus thailandensis]|uniref:Lon proteolytic domain-containing protein n=1 Tax=Gracilibacillus thailandensis TaxID=563735 RepID=A0A6N7QZA3_9BACI|nr:S16 family serine protease [Gracilibacillus thailandensis]MRI66040.1 hypothetical protein [Gracilibacillus thailandensis]